MSTRTVRTCDRCKNEIDERNHEITLGPIYVNHKLKQDRTDICSPCYVKLMKFMREP